MRTGVGDGDPLTVSDVVDVASGRARAELGGGAEARMASSRQTVAAAVERGDVVYGVKDPLIVEFVKRPPGKAPNGEIMSTPFYEVKYDFILEEAQAALAAAE